jgi:hypothetical protein
MDINIGSTPNANIVSGTVNASKKRSISTLDDGGHSMMASEEVQDEIWRRRGWSVVLNSDVTPAPISKLDRITMNQLAGIDVNHISTIPEEREPESENLSVFESTVSRCYERYPNFTDRATQQDQVDSQNLQSQATADKAYRDSEQPRTITKDSRLTCERNRTT